MPMRAVCPLISISVTTMSSPSTIFSPGRRVMMSIGSSSLEPVAGPRSVSQPPDVCAAVRASGSLAGGGELAEQRRAQLRVLRVVDHLVAVGADDHDRGAQV